MSYKVMKALTMNARPGTGGCVDVTMQTANQKKLYKGEVETYPKGGPAMVMNIRGYRVRVGRRW
jgi:hypothetical protein